MLRQPTFRLIKEAETLDSRSYTRRVGIASQTLPDVADAGRIMSEFNSGATIALQALHRYWLPLTRFCRDLELGLTHPVQANAYITPPRARGLGVHFDTHDVFVLQVSGTKHWVVYEPTVELPLPAQKCTVETDDPPILDITLRPGDFLYVPRGFLHAAISLEEVSAHLTIGILADTWYDLLLEVTRQAVEEVAFRAALPVGYAWDGAGFADAVAASLKQFATWVAQVDPEEVSQRRLEYFWGGRTPILAGHLAQVTQLEHITDDSRVRWRPGSFPYLVIKADSAVLLLGDRQLRMPARLETTMRLITSRKSFIVSDLKEDLDPPGRLVLVRRLVQEGALEVVGRSSPRSS
jgi:lysine-specific demethylase/histidyl-hydroxylase NO66